MGAAPYSNLEVVSAKHGIADGLQAEQPGLLLAEKPKPKDKEIYGMHMIDSNDSHSPREKLIFGFRQPTFWLSLALIVAIIAAAGVGAGLGVSKMNQAKQIQAAYEFPRMNDTQGSSPVPANSTITLKPTTDCPGSNGQFLSTAGDDKYQKFCNATLGGWYDEVTSAVMDSFDNCIVLCANINYNLNRTDISAMYSASGSNQYKPGYCLCGWSRQPLQQQVVHDDVTDLAVLSPTASN